MNCSVWYNLPSVVLMLALFNVHTWSAFPNNRKAWKKLELCKGVRKKVARIFYDTLFINDCNCPALRQYNSRMCSKRTLTISIYYSMTIDNKWKMIRTIWYLQNCKFLSRYSLNLWFLDPFGCLSSVLFLSCLSSSY